MNMENQEESRWGNFFESEEDFEKIKKKCLEGSLYEDTNFPAENASIDPTKDKSADLDIQWKRPHEISEQPQFVHEGITRFDVNQGGLGNCWFLAAMASLTMHEKMFNSVVPPKDNSFEKGHYCGAFHFRFWQYGQWRDVIIDDRLPTRGGKLVYLRSDNETEFWPALFEKAYAKLYSSYEALSGGFSQESFVDFTGGITESYEIKKGPENLFGIMDTSFSRGSLLAVGIFKGGKDKGLPGGHAYSITCVKKLELEGTGVVELLRIRNPWGNETEWTGDWSDKSDQWKAIPEEKRDELGLTVEADGEFWMSFEDFKAYCDILDICHLDADGGEEEVDGKLWKMNVFEGSWTPGATAGGSLENIETFASNPQYMIQLECPEGQCEDVTCAMLMSLMQKNQRKKLQKSLPMAFYVFPVENADAQPKPLPPAYFTINKPSAGSAFGRIKPREISMRVALRPGSYVIIPCTQSSNMEGEFMLRVFTESKVEMRLNDSIVGIEISNKNGCRGISTEFDTWDMFMNATYDSEEMTWTSLKVVLDNWLQETHPDCQGFTKDTYKSLVALVDFNMKGKLDYEQFCNIWTSLQRWEGAFNLHDKDNSGRLNSFELRPALNSAGYSVNNEVLRGLVIRYGDETGQVLFEDFIKCLIRLRGMIGHWCAQAYSAQPKGAGFFEKVVDFFLLDEDDDQHSKAVKATFSLEEWLAKTVYI